ncbi:MAG: (d)CMP kinase [Crocinitomicaceae bacterium]|nr:(d)CMP kinase [Crocinitomicaceae bacterium]
MGDKITIAIDGFSSCGKSTLAKELARKLHYVFIDSGAMYRGITLFALNNDCIKGKQIDRRKLISVIDDIELSFQLNPETKSPELLLNGENVEFEIRTPRVSGFVSEIAAIKEVREKLVSEQRLMGLKGGIVMDGRDIGSVVFPNAELKLFVTAEIDIRVERRYQELLFKEIETTREEVKTNLIRRDHIDSTRSESPLIKTDDAIVIDNSTYTKDQQLSVAFELVQDVLSSYA